MKNNIIFRVYKDEDNEKLEDIIRKTWKLDKYSHNDIQAKLSAKIYLLTCLSEQTFTCVAEQDGIPIGIIMVNDNNHPKLHIRYKLKTFGYVLKLFFSGKTKTLRTLAFDIMRIYENLYKNANKKYDGTIEFFAMAEESRGLGIGKNLFNKALNYMKNKNISNFYLYTDTACTYQFYDKIGMQRRSSITENKHSTAYYLYDCEVKTVKCL